MGRATYIDCQRHLFDIPEDVYETDKFVTRRNNPEEIKRNHPAADAAD